MLSEVRWVYTCDNIVIEKVTVERKHGLTRRSLLVAIPSGVKYRDSVENTVGRRLPKRTPRKRLIMVEKDILHIPVANPKAENIHSC